jgi:hypothetical protein
MLRAEWTAIQATIREIHESEKQHQAAERDLWKAQHRTAKGLNWITAIGAGVGFVGLLFVGGSLVVAIRAANDARDALHASQRPWVVADSVEMFQPVNWSDFYCHIGFEFVLKNTGNSVATKIISDAAAHSNEWKTLQHHLDDGKEAVDNLLSTMTPKDWPIGMAISPGQTITKRSCGIPADFPTEREAKIGAFIIIGFAQYRDQFGLLHHTRFSFVPTGDSIHLWDGKTFREWEAYQEAD